MFTALGVNILCVQETRLGKDSHPSPELRPLLAPYTILKEAATRIEGRPISAAKQIKKQAEEEEAKANAPPPKLRKKAPRKSPKENGKGCPAATHASPPPSATTHTQHLSGGLLMALSHHQLGNLATQIAPPPSLQGLI